jgi:hypothetical protein
LHKVRALSPLSSAYESVVSSRASVESCQLASDRQDRRQQQELGVPVVLLIPIHASTLLQRKIKDHSCCTTKLCSKIAFSGDRVESCCGQGCTAERVVPAVILRIELCVEHLGSVSLIVGYIQPLSLPEHSESPVCPPAALEQCCRVWCFPLFQD